MAYTGATTPETGTTSTNTLTRDIKLDTLSAFTRSLVFAQYIYKQTISGGTGGQFIVEGKEDTADGSIATYTSGAQVDVTNGTQDERVINLDRPYYLARRVDKFKEMTANYDVLRMQLNQIGANLAAKQDRKIAAAIEAASLATGRAGNGNGTVVVNTALPGGAAAAATPAGLGDEIAESIFAAVAAIRGSDAVSEVYVAMNPTNYSYLVQSGKAVNADYTSANGGFDTGKVMKVGGANIIETNQLPSTAGLIALAFTEQAAGMVQLWDLKTDVAEQEDFLGAKLVTGSCCDGVGVLRPNCAVSIKNA
jgi:hypothetical protein